MQIESVRLHRNLTQVENQVGNRGTRIQQLVARQHRRHVVDDDEAALVVGRLDAEPRPLRRIAKFTVAHIDDHPGDGAHSIDHLSCDDALATLVGSEEVLPDRLVRLRGRLAPVQLLEAVERGKRRCIEFARRESPAQVAKAGEHVLQ
ncbi:MAG: hypothetical protein V4684_17170 [Pseudomonadota bacterium]